MGSPQVERISRKQAMGQISTICFPLLLYSVCNLILQHGPELLKPMIAGKYTENMIALVLMILAIFVNIFIATVPMRIASHKLSLDFKAYLKHAKINLVRKICLCSTGIAVMFGLSAMMTGVSSIIHPAATHYSFVGLFHTKEQILLNAVYVICFVILRPITEEYIFRAVAQRHFGHYSRFFGVVASAFLYALVQPSLANAVPAFFFGWFLALVTLRYHSIYPAMQIHVAASLFSWIIAVVPNSLVLLPTVMIIVVYAIAITSLVTGVIRINIVHPGPNEVMLWQIFLKVFCVRLCILTFIAGTLIAFFV